MTEASETKADGTTASGFPSTSSLKKMLYVHTQLLFTQLKACKGFLKPDHSLRIVDTLLASVVRNPGSVLDLFKILMQ